MNTGGMAVKKSVLPSHELNEYILNYIKID